MYAVITGGSRGIGKALAYEYAKHGFDLVLTCEKNIDLLNNVKLDIEKQYKKKVIVKKGLLDENDIKDIASDIYILINNAGKCDYNMLTDVSIDRFREIVYANLEYTFFTTKLLSKYMIKKKDGVIANITSMWGILGSACEVVYSLTKAGLIGFTKAYAKELKDANVDVIAFALGAVNTDMCKEMVSLYKDKEELEKGIAEFVKTLDDGRMYEPNEIAEKIYDYISKKDFSSGDIIELNNGLK